VSERRPLTVVLCDDVPELRTLMRYGLQEDGDLVVVGEAGDATAGVQVVTEQQPDAILLDLSMPGMDGLQAIPLLRAAAPSTVIVVFSGFAAERMAALAEQVGADRYVEKGAEMEAVRDALRAAVAARLAA
jgi:DNA-binding NarL/FixJ family response regulator